MLKPEEPSSRHHAFKGPPLWTISNNNHVEIVTLSEYLEAFHLLFSGQSSHESNDWEAVGRQETPEFSATTRGAEQVEIDATRPHLDALTPSCCQRPCRYPTRGKSHVGKVVHACEIRPDGLGHSAKTMTFCEAGKVGLEHGDAGNSMPLSTAQCSSSENHRSSNMDDVGSNLAHQRRQTVCADGDAYIVIAREGNRTHANDRNPIHLSGAWFRRNNHGPMA